MYRITQICLACCCLSTAAHAATLRTVALSGQPAPGAPNGISYGTFRAPVLNDVGQTAFHATLIGSGVDSTNYYGLWSEGSGSLALVARSGSHAPGMPSGVNYARFSFCVTCPPNHSAYRPALNNAGQTAFRASLTGSGADSTNDTGIWSEGSGSLALVAREGNQAPGTHDGVNFGDFFDGAYITPALNNAAQITFRAKLAGSGVDSTNDSGIWSGGSGSLALVARTSSQAPGTPSGVNYQSFSYPALNDAGQTTFHTVLTGSGVDSTNNTGIWATDRSGALQLIARTGDALEVARADFRTVNGLSFVGISGSGSSGNSERNPQNPPDSWAAKNRVLNGLARSWEQ
jgi:hypothetical protein